VASSSSHSAHLSKPVGGPAEWAESLDRLGLEVVRRTTAVCGYLEDFPKTTTLGNWSADILVRSRSSVNPEADRNVRAGAGQNSSRALSNQGRAEVQGGRRQGRHSYQPRATPWVHQPETPSALKARFILRPTSRQPEAYRKRLT